MDSHDGVSRSYQKRVRPSKQALYDPKECRGVYRYIRELLESRYQSYSNAVCSVKEQATH